MATKRPEPVFELRFDGPGIYPEKIPLGTLARTLAAVQRIAEGGEAALALEDDEELRDDASIRLLDVRRGSAVFRFVGHSPDVALESLREAGRLLDNPEGLSERDYLLSPIERLSATAKALECTIVVQEPGKNSPILARIEPGTYDRIAKSIFMVGDTAITGTVQRVGGATDMRCALRVGFQPRMLFCRVASIEVARQLGDKLYQEVAIHGSAKWIKGTWRVLTFTINSVNSIQQGSILEAIDSLRKSGGCGWDEIDDPQAYLEEVTGK